jgi:beta-galactosidase
LEDHATQDPVAAILANRLISHVQKAVPAERNKNTIFIGDENEKKLLDDVGMNYKKLNTVDGTAELIICGTTTAEQEKALLEYVQTGGKILLMPKTKPGIYFGAEYVLDEKFEGGNTIANWPLTNGLSISDIRYRTAMATLKIKSGCDISLDGLLGKKQLGKGEIIYCQLDPNRFNADSLTYFRFTRWRATRAFTQVATNLGATFTCDLNIFREENKEVTHIDLDKTIWKAKLTAIVPAADDVANKIKDPGISKEATLLVMENADENTMINTNVPMTGSDEINTILQSSDGEVVFRKTIDIPDNMAGKDLVLNLAAMDDFDYTYFNGILVGFTDDKVKDNWSFVRTYEVPAKLVKPGKNVIAIRIWDCYGGGGIFNSAPKREITLKEKPKEAVGLYHLDYRTDFELGDNPFRYFRW